MHPLNVCLQGDDEFLLQHIRSDTISCVIQSLLTNYACTCVCVLVEGEMVKVFLGKWETY